MTLLDMQRVLSRILTDREFERDFAAGRAVLDGQYQLTDRELRSLRTLRWDRVGAHARMLAQARLELALRGLPLTGRLIGRQLRRHLYRFCAEYPPAPVRSGLLVVEALRLCEFAERLASAGEITPNWTVDLVRYERTSLTLTTCPEAAASAERVAGLNDTYGADGLGGREGAGGLGGREGPGGADGLGGAGTVASRTVPVCGPHAALATFHHPVVELITELGRGSTPGDVDPLPRPLTVLFHKPAGGRVRTIHVGPPVAALIEACDGRSDVGAIAAAVSGRFGTDLTEHTFTAIRRLRDAGIIGLRKGR